MTKKGPEIIYFQNSVACWVWPWVWPMSSG